MGVMLKPQPMRSRVVRCDRCTAAIMMLGMHS